MDDSIEDPEGTPTVNCSVCDRIWVLSYELDDLKEGNRALERFALDHHRHTGHYPDEITPWQVDCRHCPDSDVFLAERPARRFAEAHARHTTHTVAIDPPEETEPTVVTEADVTR